MGAEPGPADGDAAANGFVGMVDGIGAEPEDFRLTCGDERGDVRAVEADACGGCGGGDVAECEAARAWLEGEGVGDSEFLVEESGHEFSCHRGYAAYQIPHIQGCVWSLQAELKGYYDQPGYPLKFANICRYQGMSVCERGRSDPGVMGAY